MNVVKARAVKSVEEATRSIPVIDFGPVFRGEAGSVKRSADHVEGGLGLGLALV
jgi:hypothetical protein